MTFDLLKWLRLRSTRPCVVCGHATRETYADRHVCGHHEEHSLACREVYEERLSAKNRVWPDPSDDPAYARENPEGFLTARDFYNDYKSYIASNEWQIKAYYAKRKAGYRCRDCGKKGSVSSLDAHHITYERLYKELSQDIAVLCR